jgi:hypothetical protein
MERISVASSRSGSLYAARPYPRPVRASATSCQEWSCETDWQVLPVSRPYVRLNRAWYPFVYINFVVVIMGLAYSLITPLVLLSIILVWVTWTSFYIKNIETQTERSYQGIDNTHWQAMYQRAHRTKEPFQWFTGHAVAGHVHSDKENDYLQLVEYRWKDNLLQYRVAYSEVASTDLIAATERAVELAKLAQRCEQMGLRLSRELQLIKETVSQKATRDYHA